MLANYKSQCESVVKGWITESTKKEKFKHISKDKIENLALEDYQEFTAECKVEITHTLGVGYAQKIIAGSTNKQGVLVSSKAEYEKAVESHLAQESSNPQHLKVLFDKIEQGAYAQHSEKSVLLTTNAIIYEHSCHTSRATLNKNALNAGDRARLGAINAVARGNIDAHGAMAGARINVVVVMAKEDVGVAKVAEGGDIVVANVLNAKAVENAINATAKEPCGAIGFVAKQA